MTRLIAQWRHRDINVNVGARCNVPLQEWERDMKYDPEQHHRRSIRLKEYDYSQSGAYFITICTYNRKCSFGEIVNGEMQLNEWGTILENELLKTSELRPNVLLDEYVVMPNHFHGIIVIMDNCRGVLQYAPT